MIDYTAVSNHDFELAYGQDLDKSTVLSALASELTELKEKNQLKTDAATVKEFFKAVVQELKLHPVTVSSLCQGILDMVPDLDYKDHDTKNTVFYDKGNARKYVLARNKVMISNMGSKYTNVLSIIAK